MSDENYLMSKKLVAALVTIVCATAAFFLGGLESLHYAVIVTSTTALYIGGQALVDAVGRFAQAKFAK